MKTITKLLTVALFGSMLGLSSCCTEMDTPEVLQAYLEYHHPKTVAAKGYDAYFDLSDGMLSAYQDPAINNCMKSIVNKVTGNDNCKGVFTLKNNEVSQSELRQTELYNYILDSKSYQTQAPIEKTLEKIVAKNNGALVITDFEEYVGGQIQQQNYAKKYFIDWLKKGNRIVFYIFDYKENGKDKHLYVTVFDTPDHLLMKETEDALKGNGASYKIFSLNNDDVVFQVPYPAVTVGGTYHDESGEDIISCMNESGEGDSYTLYNGLNAEYYPFEESWTNIVTNVRDAKEPDSSYKPQFQHLISGLKVYFKRMSGYNVSKLDILISDVQDDYDKFYGYYDFKKNGNNAGDDGKVLSEYDYEKQGATIAPVSDMFAFTGSVKDNVADISIDFRSGFSGVVANMPPTDMLRVDVVITGCEPKYDLLPSLFEWQGNRSLVEAIKNTLQDQNPKGKVIYSYFIKSLSE